MSNVADYSEYLKTPHWLETRAVALKRAGSRCQVCSSTKLLEVHHNTYENLGHEKPEDLCVLCDECHELYSKKIASQREEIVSADLFMMLLIAANQKLYSIVRNAGISLTDLDDERARTLFVALEEAFRDGENDFGALCARIEDSALRETAIRKASSGEFDLNPERLIADGVKRVRERALRRKTEKLGSELRRMEKEAPDPARARELLAEKMHLDGELARLGSHGMGEAMA